MSNINKQIRTGVVYTSITGNYDELCDHSYINPYWDYICYTDNYKITNPRNSTWQIRPLMFDKLDDCRNQRWHKMHPHELFPEYEKSLWLDANIDILDKTFFDDIEKLIQNSIKISIAPHPYRNCIYDELNACIDLGKDDKNIMEEQIALIKKDGFPENQGLFDASIIFREHHDKQVIDIMEYWWWWVKHYSRRDQLSFTYVLWKKNIKIEPLSDKTYRNGNKVTYRHDDRHITREELIVLKNRLQQQVANLRQEIESMKSSKFWKMRNVYVKIRESMFANFLKRTGITP